MKIFVAQINPTVGDLDGNTRKIIARLEQARTEKAHVVLFPEMAICGYPPEDLVYHSSFVEAISLHLEKIVRASTGLFVVVGLVRFNPATGEKHLLNSAAVIHDSHILGFHDKWLLPTYDVFDERRYYEPGKHIRTWRFMGKRIGIVICEDMWQHAGFVEYSRYSRDPIVELQSHHPDLLFNISASPYQFQKPDTRVQVCAKAAQTLKCPVVMCCQIGANGQLIFDGYSTYVNDKGELCRLGKGFEEDNLLIDLNAKTPICRIPTEPMQELYSALTLGVRDYFKKFGFKKACLGISGGIDSALVAVLAVEALGKENLLGISMPSDYTSPGSRSDARNIAENLGIQFKEIPIKEPFTAFLDLLKPQFEGKPVDVTEENLQARIRGIILMAISNKMGNIVLSTGNKSEMALGYSTLYGDMCGGLGVLGDVAKTKIFELCRWINREKEIVPWGTINRPPSAELRPDQKDSDSLPDYAIVDGVLEGYVENHLSLSEIASKYDIPLEIVMDLVHRIHKAEYKRRQGPPILRVTKKSFGVGRRYPIVQGWL